MHRLLSESESTVAIRDYVEREALYHGMRLSANEYFKLEDDGCRYELIDGVVCMTPSPLRKHRLVASEVAWQLMDFLKKHPVGELAQDIDVYLSAGPGGRDLIYRPDIVFFKAGRIPADADHYDQAPDLIVEVASLFTRRFDRETKRADYERFGVLEYWIVDPTRRSFAFFRLVDGRYAEMPPEGDFFRSRAVEGFTLDLAAIRQSFEPKA